MGFVVEDFTTKIFFEGFGIGFWMDVDLLLGETGFFKTFGFVMAGFNQKGFSIFSLIFLSATFAFEGLAIDFSMDGEMIFTGSPITDGDYWLSVVHEEYH